jgi:hypothetical protein
MGRAASSLARRQVDHRCAEPAAALAPLRRARGPCVFRPADGPFSLSAIQPPAEPHTALHGPENAIAGHVLRMGAILAARAGLWRSARKRPRRAVTTKTTETDLPITYIYLFYVVFREVVTVVTEVASLILHMIFVTT